MSGGMPIRLIVASIAAVAVLSDTPRGRLKEPVPATRPSWWLTTSGVSLCAKRATLDRGIIVSALVLPAVPVDEPIFPVAPIELVARLRTAFAAMELTDVFCRDEATVPATAFVVCVPLAAPPEVET